MISIAKHKATASQNSGVILETTTLCNLATDCLRFTMYFFHPIQQSAQHIYHTALPLSPASSWLHKSYLHSITDNQLSHVTAFSGAPDTWGPLLRTINIRQNHPTCIATSAQWIIAACGGIINTYDRATGVLQSSLHTSETVTKIQNSVDDAILFFMHSISVTMWDIETGGHIHTFTMQSKINDIAVSATGEQVACGLSDGSVTIWNTHTGVEGEVFRTSQPVVAIYWLSPQELTVVTERTLHVHNIIACNTLDISIPGHVWGMVYLKDESKFMVGTSLPSSGVGKEECFFVTVRYTQHHGLEFWEPEPSNNQSPTHNGQLLSPVLMDKEIICITPPSGVQLFDAEAYHWTNNPPLLDAAISVALSLDRNLVVQTKDSIHIFSPDILASAEAHKNKYPSHIYALGEKHIICIHPTRHLTLLELETLQEVHPDDGTLLPISLPINQSPPVHASPSHGLVMEFSVSAVIQAWQSSTPLPEYAEAGEGDVLLRRWSPECTRIITVYGSPQHELHVTDAKDGITLASLPLQHDRLEMGEVYDLTFDSETRFYLKVDGPEWHVQIPHDVIASPSGHYSHKIIKGKPEPLSEPRATPLYALDANCEWVIDTGLRKICWLPPVNIRKGNGGYFWAGVSLVMVGDDGTVRKLTFKEPDC